jgi:hypothetical protein
VDHPGAVDGGQRGGHPDRDTVQIGRGERPALLDDLGQAGPVDVLDHQVGLLVVGVGVEHLGGAERRHLPRPGHLAAEPAAELVVGGQVGAHHLDRDQHAPGGAAQVDGAHAALAEPADELICSEGTGVPRAQRLPTLPRHPRTPSPRTSAATLSGIVTTSEDRTCRTRGWQLRGASGQFPMPPGRLPRDAGVVPPPTEESENPR